MRRATTIAQVRAWRRGPAGSVGLVPTMGALHEGHVSLVRRARDECDRVAASVFVNPAQFGPGEDLARYPRDLERDAALLEAAGCDLLFAPPAAEIYPEGFDTRVEVGAVADRLEGERRPGHFRGVATVVAKLFGIFEPTCAYFGEKDAQQLAVIRRMVRDLDLPVAVVGCATVREADGLAMSSRNAYLDAGQRRAATVLYRALQAARLAVAAGERDADAVRARMRAVLSAEPLAEVDYVSVADERTFAEIERLDRPARALLAVRIGPARLIDNVTLEPGPTPRPDTERCG